MSDYIHLTTYDYKLAFAQVTSKLPNDVQQIIWCKLLEVPHPYKPPRAPQKPQPSVRLRGLMKGWSKRKL